jgi:hypothetical protein
VLLVLLDVVIGSALGALDLNPALHRIDRAFRIPHPLYHHALRPGIRTEGEWGAVVHPIWTNSLGFKDGSTREVPRRAEARRLLLMGDSFTEGIGIRWEETFAGLLERRLIPRGIEVLNAGVASYSPIIHRRLLAHLIDDVGLQVDRVIVFIDVSDSLDDALNYDLDARGNVIWTERDGVLDRLTSFVENQTIIISTIRSLVERAQMLRRWRAIDEADAWRTAFMAQVRSLLTEHEPEGLRRGGEHMDVLLERLREREIPLSIAVHPWPDQIRRSERESPQLEHWRAWAKERGVGFVDLYAPFMRESATESFIAEHFIAGDVHWSHKGHVIVAEAVESHLLGTTLTASRREGSSPPEPGSSSPAALGAAEHAEAGPRHSGR